MHRIPGMENTVSSILVAVVYPAANILAYCLGTGTDFATKMGSLSSANSLLVAITATRHSVLVYLLGLSFAW